MGSSTRRVRARSSCVVATALALLAVGAGPGGAATPAPAATQAAAAATAIAKAKAKAKVKATSEPADATLGYRANARNDSFVTGATATPPFTKAWSVDLGHDPDTPETRHEMILGEDEGRHAPRPRMYDAM
ncbi:hypothetical protein [Streptomyces tibetensis]|uniref:hypothetical protein n=1 Tax=Streptomyces tibetensis TaxID=2382123 RepID=UPI0033F7E09D